MRAVKLPSTVVLPPFTAGSSHISGPKEANMRGYQPLYSHKKIHNSCMRKAGAQFSFVPFSWHSSFPCPENDLEFGKPSRLVSVTRSDFFHLSRSVISLQYRTPGCLSFPHSSLFGVISPGLLSGSEGGDADRLHLVGTHSR